MTSWAYTENCPGKGEIKIALMFLDFLYLYLKLYIVVQKFQDGRGEEEKKFLLAPPSADADKESYNFIILYN